MTDFQVGWIIKMTYVYGALIMCQRAIHMWMNELDPIYFLGDKKTKERIQGHKSRKIWTEIFLPSRNCASVFLGIIAWECLRSLPICIWCFKNGNQKTLWKHLLGSLAAEKEHWRKKKTFLFWTQQASIILHLTSMKDYRTLSM